MPLTAGTVTANTKITVNSMAAAIETAFTQLWPDVITDRDLPETTPKEMQLLFVAIAQGVVSHLEENPDSFELKVDVDVVSPVGGIANATGVVEKIETA